MITHAIEQQIEEISPFLDDIWLEWFTQSVIDEAMNFVEWSIRR